MSTEYEHRAGCFVIPDYRVARRAWIALAMVIAAAFMPSWRGWDMMRGGYAWITMCVFLGLVCVVTAVIFGLRGRRMAALLSGRGFLAEWKVNDDLWRRSMAEHYKGYRSANLALLWIVGAWCAVIGIGFLIYDRDAGRWVFLMLMVVFGLCAIAAVLAPWLQFHKLLSGPTSVVIGRKGALVGNVFHDWSMLLAVVESAKIEQHDGLTLLVITYVFPLLTGPQTQVVRIPVPVDKLESAKLVASALES